MDKQQRWVLALDEDYSERILLIRGAPMDTALLGDGVQERRERTCKGLNV